jgi:hypothetical protein
MQPRMVTYIWKNHQKLGLDQKSTLVVGAQNDRDFILKTMNPNTSQ